MILILIASMCIIASVALWKYALNFQVDASPVGSMMIVVSIAMMIIGIFICGMILDRLIMNGI